MRVSVSRVTEKSGRWSSSSFLIPPFYLVQAPKPLNSVPTFQTGLPSLTNPLWKSVTDKPVCFFSAFINAIDSESKLTITQTPKRTESPLPPTYSGGVHTPAFESTTGEKKRPQWPLARFMCFSGFDLFPFQGQFQHMGDIFGQLEQKKREFLFLGHSVLFCFSVLPSSSSNAASFTNLPFMASRGRA